MFLGEFVHNIDDKGRLTIPAKFRGELAAGLVVTRGFDRNLMLYPMNEWNKLATNLTTRPLSETDVRTFRRRVFSGATDLEPDKQGRIIIPQYLREFAGINGEVVVIGMYNYVEIWNNTAWQVERTAFEENDSAERWSALGI